MSESDIQEILPAPNDAPRSLSSSLKDVIEYKLSEENLSNEVHSYFYVQFLNGRKTDIRKCIKCGEKVKSINSGTTTLHRHHNTCSKDANKKRSNDQNELPYALAPKVARNTTGLALVAKLVYDDEIPITRIA